VEVVDLRDRSKVFGVGKVKWFVTEGTVRHCFVAVERPILLLKCGIFLHTREKLNL